MTITRAERRSGTRLVVVGAGLAESEVGVTVFERVIYTCIGLGAVSFSKYSEVTIS